MIYHCSHWPLNLSVWIWGPGPPRWSIWCSKWPPDHLTTAASTIRINEHFLAEIIYLTISWPARPSCYQQAQNAMSSTAVVPSRIITITTCDHHFPQVSLGSRFHTPTILLCLSITGYDQSPVAPGGPHLGNGSAGDCRFVRLHGVLQSSRKTWRTFHPVAGCWWIFVGFWWMLVDFDYVSLCLIDIFRKKRDSSSLFDYVWLIFLKTKS